jgi:hypothetical protein
MEASFFLRFLTEIVPPVFNRTTENRGFPAVESAHVVIHVTTPEENKRLEAG